MTDRIEVALFGAGRIGTIHAGNLARHPRARLRHVVDTDAAAAAALAGRHGAGTATVYSAKLLKPEPLIVDPVTVMFWLVVKPAAGMTTDGVGKRVSGA